MHTHIYCLSSSTLNANMAKVGANLGKALKVVKVRGKQISNLGGHQGERERMLTALNQMQAVCFVLWPCVIIFEYVLTVA